MTETSMQLPDTFERTTELFLPQLIPKCPVFGCTNMLTELRPAHADWVGMGFVLCSQECHAKVYDLQQYSLPF